ncbi:MAG: endolytic transglycosylase MltG [Actinomycetaceae bacterium]|nr:endolytic transglycosylase MltG [Arcanobacterium sp.]MDD7504824.1 endolytic transglycosylase MltG [Actinomycetaceae bacterium]MDY6143672.1 endolytic transglycosylase MltG [Arcanobacterium sp.]
MTQFFEAPQGEAAKPKATPRMKKQKSRVVRTGIALLVTTAVVVFGGVVAWPHVLSAISATQVEDYEGAGNGEVVVTIPEGATGTEMGTILADADVVASPEAFTRAFKDNPRATSIQAGTYNLKKQMSGASAVSALLDPANIAEVNITIPEGFTVAQVIDRIATTLEVDAQEVSDAAADTEAIGLPEQAGGKLEGWLTPLTYTFGPDVTPTEVFRTAIEERVKELNELNIAQDQWERVLIVASIVEREVNVPEYYPQVSRVIENRLVDDTEVNRRLQMDSTVLYGLGRTSGVPNGEDLDTDTPYNTYIHEGLPPTPISNPGKEVIEASLNPPEGDWLYFVTVNLDSGETLFTNNFADHQKNVQALRDWMAANPQ